MEISKLLIGCLLVFGCQKENRDFVTVNYNKEINPSITLNKINIRLGMSEELFKKQFKYGEIKGPYKSEDISCDNEPCYEYVNDYIEIISNSNVFTNVKYRFMQKSLCSILIKYDFEIDNIDQEKKLQIIHNHFNFQFLSPSLSQNTRYKISNKKYVIFYSMNKILHIKNISYKYQVEILDINNVSN